MKLKCILYYCILFIPIFICSCESNFIIRTPDYDTTLVANCVINAGDSVRLTLTGSIPFQRQNDSTSFIRNAFVVLAGQGFKDTLKWFSSGPPSVVSWCYKSATNDQIVPGKDINLKILVPGYPEITSFTRVPQPVPVLSADTAYTNILNGGQFVRTFEVKIRFKDPPQSADYYRLVIDRRGLLDIYNSVTGTYNKIQSKYIALMNTEDKNAIYLSRFGSGVHVLSQDGAEEESWYDEIFLPDKTFNGAEYILKVNISMAFLFDLAFPPSGITETERRVNIWFESITSDYYKYAESYINQVKIKSDIFSEPAKVYTNIINGLGLFSSSSVLVDSSITLKVKYSPPIN